MPTHDSAKVDSISLPAARKPAGTAIVVVHEHEQRAYACGPGRVNKEQLKCIFNIPVIGVLTLFYYALRRCTGWLALQ